MALTSSAGRTPFTRIILILAAALLAVSGCGASASATPTAGAPGTATSSPPTSAIQSPAASTVKLPSGCDGFGAPTWSVAFLGGYPTLDASSSHVDQVQFDCFWDVALPSGGVARVRLQLPKDFKYAFGSLVASQEGSGSSQYVDVGRPGFEEARFYAPDTLIAQAGGVALWIQTKDTYPQVTSGQLVSIAEALFAAIYAAFRS